MTMKHSLLAASLLALTLAAAPAYAQQTPGTGANYETRLSGLEDQMRNLNGELEQLQYNIRTLTQNLQRMQTDYDARLSHLEQQAAVAQQPAPQPQAQVQTPPPAQTQPEQPANPTPNGTLGDLQMENGKVVGGVVNPKSPALPNTPGDYGLTPQEQYDRAFGLLRQADYDDAETAFKSFIDKNPKDKLLDNAKYWYGETLYVRGKFDESAVAFADAYQQNPQGTKAPDSLLKLGMSLANINKSDDACVTLGELKSKYPNASATVKSRADSERAKLKCDAKQ